MQVKCVNANPPRHEFKDVYVKQLLLREEATRLLHRPIRHRRHCTPSIPACIHFYPHSGGRWCYARHQWPPQFLAPEGKLIHLILRERVPRIKLLPNTPAEQASRE
eukprot:gnl/Trimastix_PCT/5042.p3 GENE.gnl/Trimastix_PCT/5042~~gnl/Trimastix_PCT/5042.p3  ORF type:complete len:106 (+),score=2.98 gnl/Trimastix_PCT/5042:3-320(+)